MRAFRIRSIWHTITLLRDRVALKLLQTESIRIAFHKFQLRIHIPDILKRSIRTKTLLGVIAIHVSLHVNLHVSVEFHDLSLHHDTTFFLFGVILNIIKFLV